MLRTARGCGSLRRILFGTTVAMLALVAAITLLTGSAFATGHHRAGARHHASVNVPPAPLGFKLVWKDDFNGRARRSLSPADWMYDTGTGYGCAGCPTQ